MIAITCVASDRQAFIAPSTLAAPRPQFVVGSGPDFAPRLRWGLPYSSQVQVGVAIEAAIPLCRLDASIALRAVLPKLAEPWLLEDRGVGIGTRTASTVEVGLAMEDRYSDRSAIFWRVYIGGTQWAWDYSRRCCEVRFVDPYSHLSFETSAIAGLSTRVSSSWLVDTALVASGLIVAPGQDWTRQAIFPRVLPTVSASIGGRWQRNAPRPEAAR